MELLKSPTLIDPLAQAQSNQSNVLNLKHCNKLQIMYICGKKIWFFIIKHSIENFNKKIKIKYQNNENITSTSLHHFTVHKRQIDKNTIGNFYYIKHMEWCSLGFWSSWAFPDVEQKEPGVVFPSMQEQRSPRSHTLKTSTRRSRYPTSGPIREHHSITFNMFSNFHLIYKPCRVVLHVFVAITYTYSFNLIWSQ